MGLSLTIGMMIKFTVIVLIAVVIDAFLYIPWKALLILVVSLVFYGVTVSIYNHNIIKII